MVKMDKIIKVFLKLIRDKYSGNIVITFNQGGVRSVKKISYELIKF